MGVWVSVSDIGDTENTWSGQQGQGMNTVEKGDRLEDRLYHYLVDQLERDHLVYGVYPANLCRLHRKRKYYCKDREADVEFDIVVEVRRDGRETPHHYLVFECKNHAKAVEDMYVRNFSDQIESVFGQAVKGILVVSHRLQSGAQRLAEARRIGVAKLDENGIDIVADRTARAWAEPGFIQTQFSGISPKSKSLMFSGCVDGGYFASFTHLLSILANPAYVAEDLSCTSSGGNVEFLTEARIECLSQQALEKIGYLNDGVDLKLLCREIEIRVSYTNETPRDADGNSVLGSANFLERAIYIHNNNDRNRERFTLAHEVGHFCLGHGKYLQSESIIERDLYEFSSHPNEFNYNRLEYQANLFASTLLMPRNQFLRAVEKQRRFFHTEGRSFGYIYVDSQPCNLTPYNQMLSELSYQFGVSKRAIEIRLTREGLITDNRRKGQSLKI